MKKYDIYAIGSPLMDIFTETGHENLAALSLKKGEMHLVNEEHSIRLTEGIKDKVIKTSPGGSAVNVAVGLAKLGGKSAFCGVIGHDEHGNQYRSPYQSTKWN